MTSQQRFQGRDIIGWSDNRINASQLFARPSVGNHPAGATSPVGLEPLRRIDASLTDTFVPPQLSFVSFKRVAMNPLQPLGRSIARRGSAGCRITIASSH